MLQIGRTGTYRHKISARNDARAAKKEGTDEWNRMTEQAMRSQPRGLLRISICQNGKLSLNEGRSDNLSCSLARLA